MSKDRYPFTDPPINADNFDIEDLAYISMPGSLPSLFLFSRYKDEGEDGGQKITRHFIQPLSRYYFLQAYFKLLEKLKKAMEEGAVKAVTEAAAEQVASPALASVEINDDEDKQAKEQAKKEADNLLRFNLDAIDTERELIKSEFDGLDFFTPAADVLNLAKENFSVPEIEILPAEKLACALFEHQLVETPESTTQESLELARYRDRPHIQIQKRLDLAAVVADGQTLKDLIIEYVKEPKAVEAKIGSSVAPPPPVLKRPAPVIVEVIAIKPDGGEVVRARAKKSKKAAGPVPGLELDSKEDTKVGLSHPVPPSVPEADPGKTQQELAAIVTANRYKPQVRLKLYNDDGRLNQGIEWYREDLPEGGKSPYNIHVNIAVAKQKKGIPGDRNWNNVIWIAVGNTPAFIKAKYNFKTHKLESNKEDLYREEERGVDEDGKPIIIRVKMEQVEAIPHRAEADKMCINVLLERHPLYLTKEKVKEKEKKKPQPEPVPQAKEPEKEPEQPPEFLVANVGLLRQVIGKDVEKHE